MSEQEASRLRILEKAREALKRKREEEKQIKNTPEQEKTQQETPTKIDITPVQPIFPPLLKKKSPPKQKLDESPPHPPQFDDEEDFSDDDTGDDMEPPPKKQRPNNEPSLYQKIINIPDKIPPGFKPYADTAFSNICWGCGVIGLVVLRGVLHSTLENNIKKNMRQSYSNPDFAPVQNNNSPTTINTVVPPSFHVETDQELIKQFHR